VGRYDGSAVMHGIAATEALAIEDGDPDALRKVIERECPRDDQTCQKQVYIEARALAARVRQRAGSTLSWLGDMFKYLKIIDGPKTVVLMSEGLVLDQGQFPQGVPREVETAAAAARATVYVLRLDQNAFDVAERKPVRSLDFAAQTEGLETIAGITGGDMFTVAGTGAPLFDRIVREIEGRYLVGIETRAEDRDGKPHRIKVSVRRPHVVVRARREFSAAPEPGVAADSTPGSAVLAALRAPLPQSGIPVRVASYDLLDADRSKVRVAVSAEFGEGYAERTTVGLGYELLDEGGTVVTGHAGPVAVPPGPDGRLLYRMEFSLAPGEYTFKFAVADTAGHIGSLDHAVNAALPRIGPVAAADLVLNDVSDLDRSVPLPVLPLVRSDRMSCSIDLRAETPPEDLRVRFEIQDASGAVVSSVTGQVIGSEDGLRQSARAVIDTSSLRSGAHTARALIAVAGQPAGARTRRFEVVR
jgi:hypothetical protein